jgi:hypothetical protein
MSGGSRSPVSEQVVAHWHLVLLDHAIVGHGCCLNRRYLPGLPGNALRRQPAITRKMVRFNSVHQVVDEQAVPELPAQLDHDGAPT